jgi:prepilin-type N-terminal cleavage/methylation domain-containing protein
MRNQGFTLIEVLAAATIVLFGLVAVASMFSYAVRANISNRQMAVATALVRDKMEQFKSPPLDKPLWKNPRGFDYVMRETTYFRTWQVNLASPQSVTITVYAENALTQRPTELIRATVVVSNIF